jgi:hypothetical protein
MANSTTPFGLRPVNSLLSSGYSGAVQAFAVPASDATAVFIGDPVKLAGTSQIINGVVYPDVAQAATGDVIVGVVVATVADTRDSPIYRAASTQRILLVNVDPNADFLIKQSAGGTALTANDIGLNANFVVGSGSTVTGLSGVSLNNTTEATTNTLDLKIVGMPSGPGNDVGLAAGTGADGSDFLVRINRHQYVNQVAGV